MFVVVFFLNWGGHLNIDLWTNLNENINIINYKFLRINLYLNRPAISASHVKHIYTKYDQLSLASTMRFNDILTLEVYHCLLIITLILDDELIAKQWFHVIHVIKRSITQICWININYFHLNFSVVWLITFRVLLKSTDLVNMSKSLCHLFSWLGPCWGGGSINNKIWIFLSLSSYSR